MRFFIILFLAFIGISAGLVIVEVTLIKIGYRPQQTIWTFDPGKSNPYASRTFTPDLNKIYSFKSDSATQDMFGFRKNPNHDFTPKYSCIITMMGDSFT